jgi:hypothetical protein
MRKFIGYKIVGLAIIMAIGMVACDQASQEPEPIGSPDGYPVATFTPSVTSVTEGDTIIYTISLDKPIDRSITFTLNQTGGTATEEDYIAAPAVLQPYTKSVEMLVITLTDYDTDASETIVGEIGAYSIADKYLLNPSTVNPTPVSLTITNFVADALDVQFSWDKYINIGGSNYPTATNVDFDFYIADATGFDIADPWANDMGIYTAATGSHPEVMTLIASEDLPDGSYILFADLYTNGFAGYGTNTTIPITAWFTRQGTTLVEFEVPQLEADAMSSEQFGYADDPQGSWQAVIAKVTIAGGKFTIFDAHDANLGTYKKSGSLKTPRPLINKTR